MLSKSQLLCLPPVGIFKSIMLHVTWNICWLQFKWLPENHNGAGRQKRCVKFDFRVSWPPQERSHLYPTRTPPRHSNTPFPLPCPDWSRRNLYLVKEVFFFFVLISNWQSCKRLIIPSAIGVQWVGSGKMAVGCRNQTRVAGSAFFHDLDENIVIERAIS